MIRSSARNLSPGIEHEEPFFPLKSHFIVTATYVRSNDPAHVQTLVGELPLNVLLMQRVLGRTLGKLLLTVFFFFFYIISVIVTNTDIVMSESAEIAVTVVTSVLIITSIVGNSLVCAVIKKNRDMR